MADNKQSTKVDVTIRSPTKDLFGSENADFCNGLIYDVINAMWLPKGTSDEYRATKIQTALESLKQIAPKDGVEGLLAVQMTATHHAAMECLRRSMIDGQTFDGRSEALKNAEKFMRLYMEQIKLLDKHRGKGDQKMVVEHVTVQSGGQAIVGQLSSGKAKKSKDDK